jgi:SAM-dependent methyltransferase
MADLPTAKVIDLHDFEHPRLLPYLHEINEQEARKFGSAPDAIIPDSKQWECAMALRALDEAGVAGKGSLIAGIGAGAEATIFALARRGCLVFPTDRYLQRSVWSDVAPAGMLIDPAQYCPLDVPRGNILPVNSNALWLNLPSNTFDGVFSSGSIEHFGSLANVGIAAREIGRILKPGGVASIATEFRLEGPADRPWFDDNVILFTEEMLRRHIIEPSGLTLRDGLSTAVSDATFESRQNLVDFLRRADTVNSLEEKRAVYPNLVLYHDGFLFCSVVLTLYKDASVADSTVEPPSEIRAAVRRENEELARSLELYQRSPDEQSGASRLAFGEVEALRAENAVLRAALPQPLSWKYWRVMRPVRVVYRRLKYGRE